MLGPAAARSSLVVGIGGSSLAAVREFLTAVVSLAVEHGLWGAWVSAVGRAQVR